MAVRQILRYFSFILFLVFLSCASRKDVAYLQTELSKNSSNDGSKGLSYEIFLQPDDMLQIMVSAENPEVAAPFNLKSEPVEGAMSGQNQGEGYLIDKNGEINFPQIGKIKLGGLTRLEAIDKIKTLLQGYITNPFVHIKVLNFKVSVLGEVKNPGVFPVNGERITLLEALSISGDMTIYGKRKEVLLIRETNGVKTINKVDITSSDFVNSPNYYLTQNDIVYVEPNKTRVNSSVVGPNVGIWISGLSLAITIIALITR